MKEIQNALFDKLKGTGWDESLRFFIKSSDFLEILEKLEYEVQEKRRFTPAIRDLMRPFELCHLDRLKVVFLVNEPYLDPSLNCGLAIACNPSIRVSIEFFRLKDELIKQYPKILFPKERLEGNLDPWGLQGCLFLNRSLTAQVGKTGQHGKIWDGFFYYIMDILSRRKNLLFVSFGVSDIEGIIGESNTLIQLLELPNHQDIKWTSDNLFIKINEFLKNKGIKELIW